MNHRTGLAAAALVSILVQPLAAQPPDDLEVEIVASGLDAPLAIRHAGDGSGRLFLVEQGGAIRILADGEVLPAPFLDLSGSLRMLLGLAFHPDYDTNGFFYVYYVVAGRGKTERTVLERYSVSGDADVADPASGEVLLEVEPFAGHHGGDVHFGPDGYLYLALGDGATGGPQAQDLSLLLGKMLRLDVDGASPYAVPADNPFVGDPTAREEIWAWGFRNPYRWSFDRGTGDLLIGDVGEGSWEEVDHQPAASPGGENYGWPCREGAHDFDPGLPTCGGVLVDPVLEFAHGPACAVIGGYVYRGAIAGLAGTYVYADWCTGTIWLADEIAPGVWQSQEWGMLPPFSVIGFGEDEAGELYVTLGDAIGRFHSPSSASLIFADGFESGGLSSWSSASP